MILDVLTGFIRELRAAGIPVSMVEAIDALSALKQVDIGERAQFKTALGATLVKSERHHEVFESVFDVYFGLGPYLSARQQGEGGGTEGSWAGGVGGEADTDLLFAALVGVLLRGDLAAVRALARQAVTTLAGIEPGRPVGGTYYLYRVLRGLPTERLLEALMEREPSSPRSPLEARLRREELETRIEVFRREVEAEIRRRLVADRGPEAVARTLRLPLLEEVDLMHANREELARLERAVHPLTRKLAARLARRRKRGASGRLDFRRTIRASLSTGGVPVDPRFRKPHPSKPEVFVFCDISGSMATFARFTLQFVYALAGQFARLRAFAFIDALDEVTEAFRPGGDFAAALAAVSTGAEVVWLDGHSDYGHALDVFWERYGQDVNPRTTVLITGDARSNYRTPRPDLLASIRERAKAVYWLNPEPRSYWDTGDSVMATYAAHCDGVFEVRNLRQLEDFVARVAAPRGVLVKSTGEPADR